MSQTRLDAYETIERACIALDDEGDPLADDLRKLLDQIYYALTSEEIAYLDGRRNSD